MDKGSSQRPQKPTPFRGPLFRPRAASTRARYRREHRCEDCGAGCYRRGKHNVLTPHHPNCPSLKEIVRVEASGICAACGATKTRGVSWDPQMGAVVRWDRCPNHHGASQTWVWPEDATQAERDELGLIPVEGDNGTTDSPEPSSR